MENNDSKSKDQNSLITPKDKQLWKGLEPTELEDGTTITIGLKISHPKLRPMVLVEITPKKGKTMIYGYETSIGIGTGVFEFLRFKVGKRKRITFPFEIESFEINTGLVKTKFRRKSH